MLKNRTWDRPQDWDKMGGNEKDQWNEISDNIEQFYRDMKSQQHISTSLNFKNMTIDEKQSYIFFTTLWKLKIESTMQAICFPKYFSLNEVRN